jgi:zinc transport system substrate-binding protein
MKTRLAIVLLSFSLFRLVAAPVPETGASVVATTSWTAAFALAAGAEDVYVLAPYEMQHPPEYELKPSDMAILAEADFVIFGGYERMADKIQEALGADAPQLLRIQTDYSLATLEASIGSIAAALGTTIEDPAGKFREFYADWRQEISGQGYLDAKVIAHAFLRPIAVEIGIEVVGVFGPAPLQAKQIVDLSGLRADIILDNWHNEVGKPLLEVMDDTKAIELINFPGAEGTRTLYDVLELNRQRVRAALE